MVAPEVLWAQRSNAEEPSRNLIYLTINASDLSPNYKLEVSSSVSFKGETQQQAAKGTAAGHDSKQYEFDLELFAEVEPKPVREDLRGKSLFVVLQKKEAQDEYWPRLTKNKVKLNFLKTDFNLWKDEDEQEDEAPEMEDPTGGMGGMPPMGMGGPPGAGGMDFASMMQGMGGMGGGGAGGMDMEAMLKQMQEAGIGGAGGPGGFEGADDVEEDSSDDEGPPPLEEA
ncbi:Hsp90 cochaperone SBA1 [Sporobolomyces koalae]|uniref:Hsp90 cochaperone SBA1 n=1 Tax=Sporobolomyces koalae TaxID=500713 RepID=UPI00317BF3AB